MPTLFATPRNAQSYLCVVDVVERFVPASLPSEVLVRLASVAVTGSDLLPEPVRFVSGVALASLAVSFLSLLLAWAVLD